jgi:ketosteroid isomerase-like protein
MALSDQDIRAIRDVSERFPGMIMNKRFDDLPGIYAENAVIMPPDHTPITGRQGIAEFLESFPNMKAFENTVEEIDGDGNMAYVRGRFRMEMVPEPGAEPVVEEGQYIEIRKKQPDGSWPLTHDIFNPGV